MPFLLVLKRRKRVATKLKHLKIKKVDLVNEGTNPDAHIKLFKNKDNVEQPIKKIVRRVLACGSNYLPLLVRQQKLKRRK